MTGFGSFSLETKDFKIEVSMKSINSRFLETKFYSPPCYFNLESELHKKITQNFKRGFFSVRINRFPQKLQFPISLKWDEEQAKKWKNLYQNLSKKLKLKNDLTIQDIIHREGVVNLSEKPVNLSQKEIKQLHQIFDKSLRACLQQRKREGLKLKKDINLQISTLQNLIKNLEALNEKQKKSFMKKKNFKRKETLLETEKFDTHEEIVRFKEHLAHVKSLIKTNSPVGRKVDFYIQELLREVNTIGAKATLSQMTLKVVEVKFCLEKIKEQIQNIE